MAFLVVLDLACLFFIAMQVVATYTPLPRKSQILRSVLAGCLLNMGLVSTYFLKGLVISAPWADLWKGTATFEMGALGVQILFTAALYGIFAFRTYARRHYDEWKDEG